MPQFHPPQQLNVINVSQVKMLSPFRYPGGKTWLVPYARQWLEEVQPTHLIEPFAGGASVALMAVSEGLVERATIVELDPNVAAVWRTILGPRCKDFCKFIRTFEPTPESVRKAMESKPRTVFGRAKRAIVLNRCTRGGIMADGVGLIKTGDGKGVASRWYPETIIERIKHINSLRRKLRLIARDGFAVIRANLNEPNTAFFVDPPYLKAGKRLYRFWDVDHEGLFTLLSEAEGSVLITYDDVEEIRGFADAAGANWALVPMKSTHHEIKSELLASFGDLDWIAPVTSQSQQLLEL